MGILRTNYCSPQLALEVVPVDIFVRSLIIATYVLITGQLTDQVMQSESNKDKKINKIEG